jgi:hypothetical protein
MNIRCQHAPGLGSSVGIATDYGLDGPGIESQWGQDFSHLSRQALGPTQPPVVCFHPAVHCIDNYVFTPSDTANYRTKGGFIVLYF